MTPTYTFYMGTVEYLTVLVTSDVDLTDQPVEISLDRQNWYTASWIGIAGPQRRAQVLMGGDNPWPGARVWPVYVRFTDTPEIPLLHAGDIKVR